MVGIMLWSCLLSSHGGCRRAVLCCSHSCCVTVGVVMPYCVMVTIGVSCYVVSQLWLLCCIVVLWLWLLHCMWYCGCYEHYTIWCCGCGGCHCAAWCCGDYY